MSSWPVYGDISNYDYDADQAEPHWASEFIAAGISGIIIGSQWPFKAQAQLKAAQAAGLRVLGTYAEPDASSAIALAHMAGCKYVGLACERGSIISRSELVADVAAVRGMGLTPWIYGNAGDLYAIAGPLLQTELIWLANYGADDPNNDRPPLTEYGFGVYGTQKLAAHQFSSTKVIAGRARDRSYVYLEDEDMNPAQIEEHQALVTILGGRAKLLEAAKEMDYLLGYGMEQAKVGVLIAHADATTQMEAQAAADAYEAKYKGSA